LLKEAYRLNKLSLLAKASGAQQNLRILFTLSGSAYTNHRKLSFKEIEPDMINLLNKISGKL